MTIVDDLTLTGGQPVMVFFDILTLHTPGFRDGSNSYDDNFPSPLNRECAPNCTRLRNS